MITAISPRKIITGCGTLLPTFSMPSSIRWLNVRFPTASAVIALHPVASVPAAWCRGSSARPGEMGGELQQQPRTEARAARRLPPVRGFVLRGAGDVEMRPRPAGDELLQEQRGVDR